MENNWKDWVAKTREDVKNKVFEIVGPTSLDLSQVP